MSTAVLAVAVLIAPAAVPSAPVPQAAADTVVAAYRVEPGQDIAARLTELGIDVGESSGVGGYEIVATDAQVQLLTQHDIAVTRLTGDPHARTSAQRRAAEPGTYDVYRPYLDQTYVGSENGHRRATIYEEYQKIAAQHPDIVRAEVIGRSLLGKPIIALRVTKGARDPNNRDGARPSVFLSAGQHAREWLGVEEVRRLTHLFVDNYGNRGAAKDTRGRALPGLAAADLTRIVDTRELWIVPVANPDGYDKSFTPGNRLWRKNMRDTNGDGVVGTSDGVDLNRNFPAHWGYDIEGASPIPTYETYRGTAPESEPETRAFDRLLGRVGFEFVVNYHITDANRLLYGVGYQIDTASPDDPIYRALAGDPHTPAIGSSSPGAPTAYEPGLLSYPFRNGGIADDTITTKYGAISFTVEMDGGDPARGGGPSRFEFQDSDDDVAQVFEKNLPFALDVVRSAADPANPVSHLGTTTPAFVPHTFPVSYGNPQPVAVDVKRALGNVTLHWSINGGQEHTAPTSEFGGGKRYGDGYDRYYHQLRGTVTDTKPGDEVKVWFTARGRHAEAFSYSVRSSTGNPVLVLAAEDYSGAPGGTLESPPYPDRTAPNYLQYYRSALDANNIGHDVYDVDAEARTAPDPLGVLSHYKAVVWYTANDSFIRGAGVPGQTGTAKLASDEILAVRDYLNEGGKVLHTGQNAANAQLLSAPFNPRGEPPYCDTTGSGPGTEQNCSVLTDDFLQYWLGAHTNVQAAVDKDTAAALEVTADSAAGPLPVRLNGGDSADNQVHTNAFVTTSSILPVAEYPQFASTVSVGFDGPSPFEPATGSGYAVATSDFAGYERLRQTVDLTGTSSAALSFAMSFDTEPASDYVMVEAHHVGQDDWTTLPDVNGHTSTDVGLSCDINWDSLHPFLAHYQTNADPAADDCTATGTTGEWHAAAGNSRGYQNWSVDLSAYAGTEVEVAISYVQDFAVSGLGVFVDDASITKDGVATDLTSFEDGLGGWLAGPPPAGSEVGTQDAWTARTSVGYAYGPGVRTEHSVYWGFGLEGVQGADTRAALLGDTLSGLGVPPGCQPAAC